MTASNPFEAYASTASPVIPDRRPARRTKAPSALDLKMEEKQRLSRTYKASKRQQRVEILRAEPRLLDFMRYLRGVGPDDGDELLDAIQASDWLMNSPQIVRAFALERIARRQDKVKLTLGMIPLDDPLPPATSVFFEAQTHLRRAGPL